MLEVLVLAILDIFGSMLNLLPSFNADTDSMSTSITTMLNLVNGASILVPVKDIFIIISLVVGYRTFMFGVWILNWIIRRIADIIP